MKKSLICLFIAVALFGCSKSDSPATNTTPTPTTPVAADVIKLYNRDTSAEILDGAVIPYNTTAELKFYFKNLTSSAIKVKAKLISVTGVQYPPAPGTTASQLCIGAQCYDNPGIGSSFPAQGDPTVDIAANGTAGDGRDVYKFQNLLAPTAPATKIDYVIEFYQYDSSNNVVGKTIKITYRHQP